MNLKSKLRNILSPNQMKRLKWALMQYRYEKTKKNFGKCKVNQSYIDNYKVIGLPNKHVFFGYYDLQQLDASGKMALIHILDENKCDPAVDSAEIAIYHIEEESVEVLTKTKAWSWQQGSRLRWHPCKPDSILFNDVENGRYVTVEYDIVSHVRKTIALIPMYDVTQNLRYGLSVNFSRLQRLRPGYGYSALIDETARISVPKEEGIFRYDFVNQQTKLLIPLDKLAQNCPKQENVEHYINHISIAPSGKRFMFFHLWASTQSSAWNMNLYVADIETGKMECIETEKVSSHYSWNGDEELLVTTAALNGAHSEYIVYDLKAHSKKVMKGSWLNRDGHPSTLGRSDFFVSDTYPINCEQFLFLEENAVGVELARVYSDPRMFDDMRCDLHPRISPDRKWITFDTTFDRRVRQVVLLHMKDGALNPKRTQKNPVDTESEYLIIGLGNRNNAIKEMFYEVIHGEIENASYIEPFQISNRFLKLVNQTIYSRKLRTFFKWVPKSIWANYHVLNHVQLDRTKTTYIILTYGTDIDRLHFKDLIRKVRNEYGTHVKFVLMLFDPVNSPLQNQGWNRVLDVAKEFDVAATFDEGDAKKYGMLHFTDPYARREVCPSEDYAHDIFFVGAEKGRGDFLRKIAERLTRNQVDADMRVVNLKSEQETKGLVKQNGYLKYDEMLNHAVSCNVILEVLCEGQNSASLRYYEAVVYNKKLLTNYEGISKMPYYDERYMKYFRTAEDIDISWIKEKVVVDYKYKGDFSLDKFFCDIKIKTKGEKKE